jgi:hypothetical protein
MTLTTAVSALDGESVDGSCKPAELAECLRAVVRAASSQFIVHVFHLCDPFHQIVFLVNPFIVSFYKSLPLAGF